MNIIIMLRIAAGVYNYYAHIIIIYAHIIYAHIIIIGIQPLDNPIKGHVVTQTIIATTEVAILETNVSDQAAS